ncbi:beta-mannosidase [bacterium]|nr:beta-mannosidase [bacterium]
MAISKKSFILILALTCLGGSACRDSQPSRASEQEDGKGRVNELLVDSLATPETVALFQNLRALSASGVLFGHQDDLAYGVGWKAVDGRSDVKEVCGDYPALYGWDLGDIGRSANLDGVDFGRMKEWIREVYGRGGVNTVSMHLDNPLTAGDAWDNSPAVRSILPGAAHHSGFLRTLDQIAAFLKDLRTPDGCFIPVVFRPYHEHNHDWSWWGKSSCTAEEYNALWRMTVRHLRDTHSIHHLLYAISPQEIRSESEYLDRYPGDAWVDILGMDYYKLWTKSNVPDLGKALGVMARLAEARGKVAALTEVGVENVPAPDWWTAYLLAGIRYDAWSGKIAWALVWRNASTDHHFGPYPGHASASDFLAFHRDPFTLFERDLPGMYAFP